MEKFKGTTMGDGNKFMESLPRDFLFVLRSTNIVRSLNKDLGGKFWNLSQGGSGVDCAFRLLYGFKDFLNVKNIFHFAPTMHKYRYEFIIDSHPKFMNIMYDNGKRAKRFLGDKFIYDSLMDENVAKINYEKSIFAIKNISKDMNCNYYLLDEEVMDFKDDGSIKA